MRARREFCMSVAKLPLSNRGSMIDAGVEFSEMMLGLIA